ncbi:polysaccharide pyruvyl transferase CsaB [Synechococcus sp. CBW1002]|uniref:polysaccharide pyruvyl transferase CsaB n=1 Tax=Synechococcus sp. CBW1002 TaxID=1353134 RepID=UPI0018CDBD08|nr:polysaccharide pyruvyl transferase CsaB [Synechococcus sp. CBW1002]QPN59569.1 polysaccharide pyruvyl transferase CsaB [Synechococcus sp. CBW1002]
MQALLCGYYGEHNLGDDALLQALLAQLPSGWSALVTAHDEAEVQHRFGVKTVQRRGVAGVLRALDRCDALVFGGGSLLQDSTSFRSLLYYAALILKARWQGKPVILWGQGLGPLRRRCSRALVGLVLPRATAISWRDPDSASLARRLGAKGLVGSDPVWGLAVTAPSASPQERPIVLCWRPVVQLRGEAWRPYLEAAAALALSADRTVLWMPFHRHQDQGLLARLEAEGLVPPALLERSRELTVHCPEEAMAVFAQAGLVIAMRLHGLILAALSGAPCAALSYDPKVAVAAAAIGCPCQDLADLPDSAALLASWRAVLDVPMERERIEAQRADAAVHQQLLVEALH